MNSFIEKLLQPRRLVPILTIAGALYRIFLMPWDWTIGDDLDDYITRATLITNHLGWTSIGNIPESLGAFGYLPGYSLLMVLFHPLTGDHFVSARLITLAMGVAVIPLCYITFKHFFGEKVGLASAALAAVNSHMVAQSIRSATEMPLVALMLLSLWVVVKAQQQRRTTLWLLAGALCAGMAALRPEGILWALALTAYTLRYGRDKKQIAAGASALAVGLVILSVSGLGTHSLWSHYTEYLRNQSPGLMQMFKNVLVNGGVLALTLFKSLNGWLLLALPGMRALEKERRGTWILWLGAILMPVGLYLVYPTYQNASQDEIPRYAAIIIPFVMVLGARGFMELSAILGHRIQYFLALAMVVGTVNPMLAERRALYWSDLLSVHNQALSYLAEHSAPDVPVYAPGSAQRNWIVSRGRWKFSETEPTGPHYALVSEPSKPYSLDRDHLALLAEFSSTGVWKTKLYGPKPVKGVQAVAMVYGPPPETLFDKLKGKLKRVL